MYEIKNQEQVGYKDGYLQCKLGWAINYTNIYQETPWIIGYRNGWRDANEAGLFDTESPQKRKQELTENDPNYFIVCCQKKQKEAKSENIGKYYQWKNGLRFRIIGINEYDEYRVCDPSNVNKIWACVALNIEEKAEVTEEVAKAQFVTVEHNTPQFALGCCGGWRIGIPNVSVKMDLKQGRLSADEAYRIEDELKKFFSKLKVIPKVSRSDDGIHIEFFDISEDKPGGQCCQS